MTAEEARAALATALHDRDEAKAAWDAAIGQLHAFVRAATAPTGPLKQAEVVRLTGYTRERIRQLTPRPQRSDAPSPT